MLVNTPPAIGHMVPRLTEFFELMAGKLMVNVHKDEVVAKDVPMLLDRLAEEVSEFKDEIEAAGDGEIDVNALEELADMGNFCFLLYKHLRDRGLKNVTERFIDEYYVIEPGTGRVYCRKSRSGSALKPGDEVKGTLRRGRVHIRAQHAISGAAISLPRAHLIWWKAKGRWPEGTLRHKLDEDFYFPDDHKQSIDNIYNLTEEAPKSNGRLPFVSQYRPKGREQSPNYGKWVYQRRHAFKLVRCGYYDTQEEAATLGLRDWKEKTRRVGA
jgi:hypothetical protein